MGACALPYVALVGASHGPLKRIFSGTADLALREVRMPGASRVGRSRHLYSTPRGPALGGLCRRERSRHIRRKVWRLHHHSTRADEAITRTQGPARAQPNLTGTPSAYRPAGALERGGVRQAASGDYQAWTPGQE